MGLKCNPSYIYVGSLRSKRPDGLLQLQLLRGRAPSKGLGPIKCMRAVEYALLRSPPSSL